MCLYPSECYSTLLYTKFSILLFQLPVVNHSLKILSGHILSIEWHPLLSSMVRSLAIPYYPARDVNRLFAQGAHSACIYLPL